MKVFVLAALLAVAAAQNYQAQAPAKQQYAPAPAPAYPQTQPTYSYPPRPYNFAYEVKDAQSYNDFGHQESSDGKTVTGSYRVALPDGRIQIVNYKADDYGYVADVKYQGEARYPAYKQAQYPAAPAYPAPAAYPAAPAPAAYQPQPAKVVPAYTAPAPAPKAVYPAPPAPQQYPAQPAQKY